VRVKVKLFGPQAAMAGMREVEVEAAEATVSGIKAALAAAVPPIAATVGQSRIAVNHEFAGDGDLIRAGDEVALIGMVSGG
jgi:molybdopterin converting factor small subunit